MAGILDAKDRSAFRELGVLVATMVLLGGGALIGAAAAAGAAVWVFMELAR